MLSNKVVMDKMLHTNAAKAQQVTNGVQSPLANPGTKIRLFSLREVMYTQRHVLVASNIFLNLFLPNFSVVYKLICKR